MQEEGAHVDGVPGLGVRDLKKADEENKIECNSFTIHTLSELRYWKRAKLMASAFLAFPPSSRSSCLGLEDTPGLGHWRMCWRKEEFSALAAQNRSMLRPSLSGSGREKTGAGSSPMRELTPFLRVLPWLEMTGDTGMKAIIQICNSKRD